MGGKQRIISLIESDSLVHTSIGMALKIFYELATVAIATVLIVPVLPFVVDGVTISLHAAPKSSVTIWAGVSVAVFQASWCFTKRGTVEF